MAQKIILALVALLVLVVGGYVVLAAVARRKAGSTGAWLPPVSPLVIRQDAKGSGSFLATRNDLTGGTRTHNGVDYLVAYQSKVLAPFDGTITRYAAPYANDSRYTGLVLTNADGFEIKLFYVLPTVAVGTTVSKGQAVGTAQNIVAKYGAPMQNHIHVELRRNGFLLNPTDYFK